MNDGTEQKLLATLNELLEGERAGARVARTFAGTADDGAVTSLLERVARDEAWCCSMLTRQVERLGGRPSRRSGAFLEKALSREGLLDRIEYLTRGQAWVVRRLQEIVPGLDDGALAGDLSRMLSMHEKNVADCVEIATTVAAPGD